MNASLSPPDGIGKRERLPLGLILLSAFFCFGTLMCLLTVVLVLFPGGLLDVVWRVKPAAAAEFAQLGRSAILLMVAVGAACALAAVGLARRAEWGRRLAIVVLAANMVGDAASALARSEWAALIGLPIAGLMIFYLVRARMRAG